MEIFISYARSTEAAAGRIAQALRALGYGVWYDDRLPAHRNYSEVIEERLRGAAAVLVLWSADAVKSQWVRAEADLARAEGRLTQASLDGAAPPIPFNQVQCADLRSWSGQADALGWRKVVESLAALTGAAPAKPAAKADAARAAAPVLAVLAFDNLSGDPEMAYFSDGVSEEILQRVARGSELKVIARSSSFHFRGADKAARRVATELKATHLLDGAVRRSGNRVRISAQLVDCGSELTLWSDRFERQLADVFDLQDEIAGLVASALEVAFAPPPTLTRIDDAAYDLYLRARQLEVEATSAQVRIELLEQVVARAPGFADAWAALCQARVAQARHGPRPRPFPALKARALEAADKALALDPNCGAAYASLSLLKPWGAYAEREALTRKAVTVARDDSETLALMGAICNHLGFTDEALGLLARAYELDPLYPLTADIYGAVLAASGHPDIVAFYDTWRTRWPEHLIFTLGPMNRAMFEGDWPRFDELLAHAALYAPEDPALRATLAIARPLREGDPELRPKFARRMLRTVAETGTLPLHTLATASSLGLVDEAFAAVEAASYAFMADEDGPEPASIYNPGVIFDASYCAAIMADPRFVGLCAKLGLCDYWVQADRWPDCAERLAPHYDFKAEARRLAAAP